MTGDVDLLALLAIHAAGGRVKPEKSAALPARSYGDPAASVEFSAERQRRIKEKTLKKSKRKPKGI